MTDVSHGGRGRRAVLVWITETFIAQWLWCAFVGGASFLAVLGFTLEQRGKRGDSTTIVS
jgi:hypothetical protein